MATDAQLVFDRVPENFRAKLGSSVVTGDVYNICDQVRALDDRLLVTDRAGEGWPEDGGFRYVISELCVDGELRWVLGAYELDQRIMERLREMLNVPFEKRFKAAEAEEARIKAAKEIEELDRMTAEIGEPMRRDLERCGFGQRPTSYSKRGTLGPGVGRGRPQLPKELILP
jgi:hypothetical protein